MVAQKAASMALLMAVPKVCWKVDQTVERKAAWMERKLADSRADT